MFCPKCGNELSASAAFCGKCGAAVMARSAASNAAGVVPAQAQTSTTWASQDAASRASALAASGVMKPARSLARTIVPIAVAAVLIVGGVAFAASSIFNGGGKGSAEALCDSFEGTVNELFADDITTDSIARYTNETLDYMPRGAVDAIVAQGGYSSQEEAVADIFGGSTLSGLSSSDSSAWDQALDLVNEALSKFEIKVDLYPGSSLDELEVGQLENEFSNLGLSYDVQEACWVQGTTTTTVLEDYYTMSAGDTQTAGWDEVDNCLAVKIDGKWYLWAESDL